MADKRIIDLTSAESVDNSAFLAIDSVTNGTQKLQLSTLIAAINQFNIAVVNTLPTEDIDTHTIYLVPKPSAGTNNVYDEYLYINNAWELIGDTEVDLSGYQTSTDNNLTTTDKTIVGAINELDSGKQDALTFDNTPTQNSTNPVTSGGLYTAFGDKENAPTIKTATLAAAATSVTFTGIPTTGNNTIDVYTSKAGLDYTAVDDTTSGQLTYTFEAQSAAVTVYLVIRGV